ncbi:hypothetical protein [Nonomuraea sp. LP-02]|uniref:hypothetical protein n=1 Tax=Nonomuraea sp. LP-02 TaxID=3097960 RepID=UPI003FA5DF1A
MLDGRPVAVTASDDATVRVWDLPARRFTDVITLPNASGGVAVANDGSLVCSFGSDLTIFRR